MFCFARYIPKLICAALCYLAIQAAPAVHAKTLTTWFYDGVFTEPRIGRLKAGDSFYGWFQFDPSTPDLQPNTALVGQYTLLRSFFAVPALNSYSTFSGDMGKQLIVQNDIPGGPNGKPPSYDFFEVYQRDTPIDEVGKDPMQIVFFNGPGPTRIFSSDALPDMPPLPSSFTVFNLFYQDDFAHHHNGSTGVVRHLYEIPHFDDCFLPIPEPAGYGAMLTGLFMLGTALRWRNARLRTPCVSTHCASTRWE